ncbi:MAG: hypothetical protein AABY22_30095 [Nanoarchaeota archaeon]
MKLFKQKMKLFKKIKTKSHKELNKEWQKLSALYKQRALQYIHRIIEQDKEYEKILAKVRKAEEGKKVGYECTCLPENKNCVYVDYLCSYCQAEYRRDYYNSPG